MDISTIVLAVATIALVAITGYYAKQTKNTVSVLKRTAELSVRPYLKGSFQQIGPVAGDLKIQNIGNGPANKIELSYWIEGKDETKRSWTKPLLMPNESDEFFIMKNDKEHVLDIVYFENDQTTIKIYGKYSDILNNEYTIDDSIDLTAYVKQWKTTFVRYRESPEQEISRNIEKIADSLRDLTREVTQIRHWTESRNVETDTN